MGIFWKKAHPKAAVVVLLLSPVIGWLVGLLYTQLAQIASVRNIFGANLNFFHKVFVSTIILTILMIVLSRYLQKKQPVDKASDITVSIQPIKRRLVLLVIALLPLVAASLLFRHANIYISYFAALITSVCFMHYNKQNKGMYIFFKNETDLLASLLAGSTVWFLFFFA